MASNGRLPDSDLAAIPGGRLEIGAAAAWNAPHGPADNGLLPSGENGTYRELGHEGDYPPPEYGTQWYFWGAYLAGVGNLAAQPGSSIHGFGKAIDLAAEWMRSWIDDHGARFGWRKTEAFSEWWHVNFVGGVSFPTFKVLKHGMRGKRVVWYTRRLAFIHPARKNHGYLRRNYWKYKDAVVDAVEDFQRDHDLQVDGKIGEDTGHAISAVFHKQYVARKGMRKRRLRDVIRRRP